ncbi:MAG: FecR family protein [Deltaproteobacteria bacterium]|nr:FecR family protein [Deltaproteobacteria bacterium]
MTASGDRERPPIEPLTDAAWTRIERAVWSELDAEAAPAPLPVRRSWRAAWIGGAALAAAAVIAVVVLRGPGDYGGAPIDGPSRIVTADGTSDVTFGDARVSVAAHSAVVLTGTADAGATIVIERGGASFAVAPRGDRPPFVVHAGEVTVRVIGTRFGVERVGERARVTVQEGVVLVVAPGEHVMVRAGEQWPVMTTLIDNTTPPTAPSTAPTAPTAPSTAPPAPAPDTAVVDHPADPRPRPALDPARAFAAAAALEATDPTAALAGYHALARGSGAWAANALYAAGRLAVERGDTARARTDLTAYVRRFPRGANARDAQQLLAHLP